MDHLIAIFISAILFSSIPNQSSAGINGSDILNKCTDRNIDTILVNNSFCVGYLDGIIEGVGVLKGMAAISFPEPMGNLTGDIIRRPFCMPEGIPLSDIADKMVMYLRSHPESLNSPAYEAVFLGLTNIYPCQRR